MADWDAPDKYEGRLILPGGQRNPPQEEASTFELIASAIEALYEREPVLTRSLLERLCMATTEDLQRLFRP
jgi:hypothetical protein